MNNQNLHNKNHLSNFRKELRSNLTPAEAKLWSELKGRRLLGRRFNRQHSIGNYIVDFYCASEKLIIELDGEVHNNPKAKAYDLKRTQFLEAKGYSVIRFENRLVFEALPSVLLTIQETFNMT
ncbi:endonuclease domain-containing protein [Winogradskyella maritima]|uniref:Endonuclease domain-containing protein n=1 Tax=Winogradskyella maritima TaxID=1517766 RepID=A0ABV8AHQ2_9FLAO|nr:endonuclease domain-containing protein [Winogradskyella maritima]